MRFVDDQSDVAVLRWDPERLDQGVANRADDGNLLVDGVLAANFDQGNRHCAFLTSVQCRQSHRMKWPRSHAGVPRPHIARKGIAASHTGGRVRACGPLCR